MIGSGPRSAALWLGLRSLLWTLLQMNAQNTAQSGHLA